MAPIRDSVSHSPNQTGLEHTGLDSQYEPSSWSSGSPCSTDSNPNWSKVLVDGSIDKSNSSSVWPPSSSSFSCSSSSSSSGCGSGSDPELASECMDADCSSSLGSDKSADVSTVKMMSASTSSVSSPSAAPPPSSTASTVMGVSINADPNGNKLVSISSGSSGNEAHYSLAGPNSIGSNNMGNHNKLNTSGVWGSQSDGNVTTPCINGALNPNMLKINANHGAWPQASQDQRTPQAKQGPLLGWGGMAAPENKMESTEANSGTTSTKVLGSSSSANGQSANLNNELNGPNNTIMMNTTTSTTSTTLTSTLPNSIASSQFTGDCSWGSIGGGNGGPLANGNHTQSTQGDLGGPGSFGTPWGATTYPGDKHVDTVNHQHPALMQAGNPQISSAAFKSNNNHNNTGASRWDQGPANNPAQSQSTLSWGGGQNQTPSSVSQSGNGNQTTMGPPTGMPRPWGSSASSSSSCSSSSSLSKMSHGEWGSATIVNTATDGTSQKGAANNGWKSLEDDAMGMGSGGEHGTGGWGRSGGSEGSAESSGGRSSSDSLKGGNRRKPPHNANLVSALTRSNVDPRVLSNAGWGQTPVQQNTAWDVTSHQNRQQAPRQSQKHPGWGNAPQSASQPSAGWGSAGSETGWGEQRSMSTWENKSSGSGSNQNTWDDGSNSSNTWSNSMNKDEGSNMWTNAPKPLQSWNGNTSESWGNNGEASRAGANNHWGDPPKGAGSMGWDSDSDRSGSGCWSEPGRTNTSSSNTWIGSGGSNTPDQSTPNHGSNWGETAHKPNSMSKNQGWGEPMKSSSGMQTWGEPTSKPGNPSNEWGKGSESSSSRGVQGTNKPSGWLGGPMPTMGPKEEMSTGWEEPSPESIRRRMEIDDGTAAWGDPGKSGSSVNMWNKSGQTDQDGPAIQHPNHGSMHSQQPMQPQEKSSGTGWGDAYPSQKESSTWGEPAAPMTVDNGTSAWEKPVNTSAWEDSNRDGREGPAWGSQHKSTHKPMGTWGGEDSNSWDQEEEVEIGMWNDNQQDTRSHEQNTWNYKQKNSKMSKPVPKQDEPWMKPFINQFNGMNFSRDSCDDSMKPGGMLDKHMGSMSDLNGVMAKNLGPRHPLHKDAMDRSPYFDKTVKPMVGGSSIAQGRGGPQSQVPPQHNLRNQVPPPILPSQVPPSLLKYPGGNGALNPLFGPQQVAVLNQLSQLNQLNQLQRLLLQQQQQQQKAQSQRAMAVGRQSEQPRPIGSSPLMMQPPRHLDPSLMKQPQPMKPYLDNYFSHNNPDIQKEAASLGPFGNFPLSVNSNLNVSMDLGVGGGSGSGSLNYKEPPQSRLRKLWATDPLEQNSKPGAMSSGLRLDDSPFYDFLPSPLSPPGQSLGSVGDGWPPRANSPPPHGNTGTWPPEFRPGEPWKGYPNIDPQSDPHLTPGSVINNLSINTVRDTDHLRDRNNGPSSSLNTTMPSNSAWPSIRASSSSLSSTAQSTSARSSDSKWSPGGSSVSNSSLAHELWKVPLPSKGLSVAAPSRPPPGLPTQKPSANTSGWDSSSLRLGGWSSSESRFTPGSSWSDSSSGRTQWLVLKNLTPQIDGSTLKTLCMQHGPLDTFHLNLPHGNAVVCYRSKEEAAKAQKSLHMCVLGNTTILADIATEEEIKGFFAQGQTMASPSSGWQAIGSSQSRMEQSFPSRASEPNQWNSGDLHSSSLWGGPNYSSGLWGSTSGTETGRMSSSSPISSFLPVDHLTGAGDSM